MTLKTRNHAIYYTSLTKLAYEQCLFRYLSLIYEKKIPGYIVAYGQSIRVLRSRREENVYLKKYFHFEKKTNAIPLA